MYLAVLAHPRQTDDRVLPKLQAFIDQQRRTCQAQIGQQTRQLSLNTHTHGHIMQMCGRRDRNIPKQANTTQHNFCKDVFLCVLSCFTNSSYTQTHSINDRCPVCTSDECRWLNVCLYAFSSCVRSQIIWNEGDGVTKAWRVGGRARRTSRFKTVFVPSKCEMHWCPLLPWNSGRHHKHVALSISCLISPSPFRPVTPPPTHL